MILVNSLENKILANYFNSKFTKTTENSLNALKSGVEKILTSYNFEVSKTTANNLPPEGNKSSIKEYESIPGEIVTIMESYSETQKQKSILNSKLVPDTFNLSYSVQISKFDKTEEIAGKIIKHIESVSKSMR